MTSKLDKAILKVIGETPEITINNLMFKLDKGNLHEGKSKRAVANHVYELRRQGLIKQLGQSSNVRYILASQSQPTTEQDRQLAEARQREDVAASVAPASTQPEQLGVCDLIDLGSMYILTPRDTRPATVVEGADEQKITAPPAPAPAPQPNSVIVLDGREKATEKPFDARVSAIAEHIGTTVTLTVRQLISEALQERDTEIARLNLNLETLLGQNQTLADRLQDAGQTTDQLMKDMAEQEQLYNDLDKRYNTLKQQLAGLAAA